MNQLKAFDFFGGARGGSVHRPTSYVTPYILDFLCHEKLHVKIPGSFRTLYHQIETFFSEERTENLPSLEVIA